MTAYYIETRNHSGHVRKYPECDSKEEVWQQIESWEAPDDCVFQECNNSQELAAMGRNTMPSVDKSMWPVWYASDGGVIELFRRLKEAREWLWNAHFHDFQTAEIKEKEEL